MAKKTKALVIGGVVYEMKGEPGKALRWEDLTEEQKAELKGDALTWEDLTEEQKAELKGEPGPQGESFQPIEDVSGLVLAHTLGGDNSKVMSQKGLTDAIMDMNVTGWEDVSVTKLSNLDIDSEGDVTEPNNSNKKVFYLAVSAGDIVRITGTHTQGGGDDNVVVAMYAAIPADGASAASVLDVSATVSGAYSKTFFMASGGYLAVKLFGQSASVTAQKPKGILDALEDIDEDLGEIHETLDGESVDVTSILANKHVGYYVSSSNSYAANQYFTIVHPFQVQKGDLLTITSSDNNKNVMAIVAKCINPESFDSTLTGANQPATFEMLVQGDKGGMKTRTYTMKETCHIVISYLSKTASDTLQLAISRGGLVRDVNGMKNATKGLEVNSVDGTAIPEENPLARLITGPSRVRVFKSYGVIGASFETGYTNAYKNGEAEAFYDVGYEWPTLMGNVNGVETYNYALAGHSFRAWLRDRNDGNLPKFTGHCLPWSNDNHVPECFIVNLSSNDISAYDTLGDVENLDVENVDYWDQASDAAYNALTFVEAAAGILQLCRAKSPGCHIFVATLRAGTGDATAVATLNEKLLAVAALFDNCHVLDITTYGMKWNTGVGKYVSGVDGSHPTRLGHVYLADQFNTYIDWYVGKHPEEFLDAAYINTEYSRTQG